MSVRKLNRRRRRCDRLLLAFPDHHIALNRIALRVADAFADALAGYIENSSDLGRRMVRDSAAILATAAGHRLVGKAFKPVRW